MGWRRLPSPDRDEDVVVLGVLVLSPRPLDLRKLDHPDRNQQCDRGVCLFRFRQSDVSSTTKRLPDVRSFYKDLTISRVVSR